MALPFFVEMDFYGKNRFLVTGKLPTESGWQGELGRKQNREYFSSEFLSARGNQNLTL